MWVVTCELFSIVSFSIVFLLNIETNTIKLKNRIKLSK